MLFFVVDYEDEIFDDFTWSESVDNLIFADLLGQRTLLKCWFQDFVTSVWIRVPRIDVLRMLLKEDPMNQTFRLRFQASSSSPNSSPHLTPTKNEINVEDVSNVADDEIYSAIAWALSIADNVIEPFTQSPVSKLDVGDLVVIQNSTDIYTTRLSIHASSLLSAIQIDAEKGISPFEVSVRAEINNSQLQEVKLTREVWMKYLLRENPHADMFLDYVTAGFENLFMLDEKLKELHSKADLWLRLKCFHYDLKRFDKQAQSRLEDHGGEYYMSNRYFTHEELNYLLTFPTASGASARQSLQALFASKGRDGHICSSHDLAPALEIIYGIRKGFEEEKLFVKYFKEFASISVLLGLTKS
jgi:hypothetical protein